jgi:hypothetical protein
MEITQEDLAHLMQTNEESAAGEPACGIQEEGDGA